MPNILTTTIARGHQIFRSVGPTISANLINQAVVAATQLAVIPLLVSRWGVSGFGSWLLLTAIPTYLTISDFGFTTSAKTDMAIRAKSGDISGAQVTVSSVAALLVLALIAIATCYLVIVAFVDWPRALNLIGVTQSESQQVLCLGLLQLASYQAFLLSASVVRAAGRPALEVLLAAAFRAVETVALVATAWLGGGLVAAALAWAATRAATTTVLWIVLLITVPDLVPNRTKVHWARIQTLLGPSLAYLLVPLASAIFIQGTVLVLGVVAGPELVAGFTTMRVVTRLGVSGANTLHFAFTPQYSYAIGSGSQDTVNSLLRTHFWLMLIGISLYLLVMLIAGQYFVTLLSHGRVYAAPMILVLLVAGASFEMLWGIAVSFGSASNRVGMLSVSLLGLSAVNLVATYILAGPFGVSGAASTLAVSQLAMCCAAYAWYHFGSRPERRGAW